MGDEHRRELLRLESVVDRIRDATRPHGTAAQIAVDECLRLLASYVRLAIAYNVEPRVPRVGRPQGLDDEMRALEAARFSPSPHTRTLAQRRLAIARKRAERWDRSREALEAIAHQLAMIGELVQLTHEQVAAPLDPRARPTRLIGSSRSSTTTSRRSRSSPSCSGVERHRSSRTSLDMGRIARV